MNTQAVIDTQVNTKTYVCQFHQENEQSRRNSGMDFFKKSSGLLKNNQDNDFNDKKLMNLDCITVIRKPSLDNEVSNKNYIFDELKKNYSKV